MLGNTWKAATIATTLLLGAVSSLAIAPTTVLAQSTTKVIAQNLLASGSFVTVEQDHPTLGKAQIVRENGRRYLEFTQDFTTATGPDVQVILHRNGSIPVKPKEADYIIVAALKNIEGAQRYELPNDVDINSFKSVGIWCRKFNVTFGYAAF